MKLLGCALTTLLCAGAMFAQESRARLEFEPVTAEVGEIVSATLVVEHALDLRPKLDAPAIDDSWIVLDLEARPTLADPNAAGRARSTWVFELASLEPGDRTLADLPLTIGDQKLAVESAGLAVSGLLAESEDAPRPMKGLREIETKEETANAWPWVGAALALCAALAAALWWKRRGRPAVAGAPAPSVRLAVLETRPLDSPQDVQAAHFALTRLLRESADLAAGRDRSGLTDEEWRRAARTEFEAAGLGESEQRALEELLERAAGVKYGSDRPTHWATREALASARGFAARLEPGDKSKSQRREVAA